MECVTLSFFALALLSDDVVEGIHDVQESTGLRIRLCTVAHHVYGLFDVLIGSIGVKHGVFVGQKIEGCDEEKANYKWVSAR